MKRLTEEEAWALDDAITNDPDLKIGPNGTGAFSRHEAFLAGMNKLTTEYIWTIAERDQKTPGEIVNDLVREKLVSAVG